MSALTLTEADVPDNDADAYMFGISVAVHLLLYFKQPHKHCINVTSI